MSLIIGGGEIGVSNDIVSGRRISLSLSGNVIWTTFSSLAALEVVILTTSSAASDGNFIKMTTVSVILNRDQNTVGVKISSPTGNGHKTTCPIPQLAAASVSCSAYPGIVCKIRALLDKRRPFQCLTRCLANSRGHAIDVLKFGRRCGAGCLSNFRNDKNITFPHLADSKFVRSYDKTSYAILKSASVQHPCKRGKL